MLKPAIKADRLVHEPHYGVAVYTINISKHITVMHILGLEAICVEIHLHPI